MKKYLVKAVVTAEYEIEIEAKDKSEAYVQATQIAFDDWEVANYDVEFCELSDVELVNAK